MTITKEMLNGAVATVHDKVPAIGDDIEAAMTDIARIFDTERNAVQECTVDAIHGLLSNMYESGERVAAFGIMIALDKDLFNSICAVIDAATMVGIEAARAEARSA